MTLFRAIKKLIAKVCVKYHSVVMDWCFELCFNTDREQARKYWAKRWTKHFMKREKYEAIIKK